MSSGMSLDPCPGGVHNTFNTSRDGDARLRWPQIAGSLGFHHTKQALSNEPAKSFSNGDGPGSTVGFWHGNEGGTAKEGCDHTVGGPSGK